MTALLWLRSHWRVIAVIAALTASYGVGRVHQGWKEGAARERAVAAALEAYEADIRKQAKAEQHEQDQQRRDAEVVKKAREPVAAVDWSPCPAIPSEFGRMLNAIGKAEPSASKPVGEVSRPSRSSGG